MKKLLALVLALVMTLSLCVTSNAAYTDAADVDYKEAVDVMSSLGVFQGDETGKFSPKDILTREQAAKIVTYMLLGKKAADALVTIAAPFADVAADRWSAGSIAYCYNEGILAGVGNGMFDPTAQLTGLQFAKMMLTALGYDAEQENLVGSQWSINAAKMALTLELTDGMDDVSLSAPMTREQACQMAFNTEKTGTVKYDTQSTITAGNVTIKTNTKAEADAAHFYAEYTKLNPTTGHDAFGAPTTVWYNDTTKIGSYAKKPAKTVVVDKADKNVTAILGVDYMNYVAADYVTGSLTYAAGDALIIKVNNDEIEADELLPMGAIVETYTKKDGTAKKVEYVIVKEYTAAKIDVVNDQLSTDFTKNGATKRLAITSLDGLTPYGTYFDAYKNDAGVMPGYTADYVEDAVLAVALNGATVIASYIPEKVTGKVSSFKANDYAYVDGTKYSFSMVDTTSGAEVTNVDGIVAGFDFDKSYDLYLDAAGNVIGVVGTKNADVSGLYYVTGVYMSTGSFGTKSYYAQAVKLADGTTENIKLEEDMFIKMVANSATSTMVVGYDETNDVFGFFTAGTSSSGDCNDATHYVKDANGNYILHGEDYNHSTAGHNAYYTINASTFKADQLITDDAGIYTKSDLTADAVVIAGKTATKAGNDKFVLKAWTNNVDYTLYSDDLYDDVKSTDTKVYLVNGGSFVKYYLGENSKLVSVEADGDDLEVKFATGSMKASDADVNLAYVVYDNDTKEAVYVVYVGTDLSGSVQSDDIVYVAKTISEYNSDSTVTGNVWFLKDVEEKAVTIKGACTANNFYTYDINKDGNYEFTPAGGDELAEDVDKDVTGWAKDLFVVEDAVRNQTLSAVYTATDESTYDFDDVSFADAKIVDVRTSSARNLDKYVDEITNAKQLATAIGCGNVTMSVYVKNGAIVYVCVTDVKNA